LTQLSKSIIFAGHLIYVKIVMTKKSPVKKEWIEPQIILISANEIKAKTHPQARESTGHVNASFPSYFNSASNGNGFKGTKYSAIS